MARKRIDELDARTDFDATCEVPLHDGVQTWKATGLLMRDYIQKFPFAAKSANYAITSADYMLTMDATAADKTFTLPTAVGCAGKSYILKKIDSSSHTVQLLTTSAQTIDGNASGDLYLRYQWNTITVVSNGANWLIAGVAGGDFLISY